MSGKNTNQSYKQIMEQFHWSKRIYNKSDTDINTAPLSNSFSLSLAHLFFFFFLFLLLTVHKCPEKLYLLWVWVIFLIITCCFLSFPFCCLNEKFLCKIEVLAELIAWTFNSNVSIHRLLEIIYVSCIS